MNEHGRPVWTDNLRDDPIGCYESSEPARRGYMVRLHALWSEMHPELRAVTPQNLRDYVAHLRSRGFVRAPQQQAEDMVEVPQPPPAEEAQHAITMPEHEGIANRRALYAREPLTPQELARADASLRAVLEEGADIWHINCAVYEAAQSLSQLERNNASICNLGVVIQSREGARAKAQGCEGARL